MKKKFKVLSFWQADSQGDVFTPGSIKHPKGGTILTKEWDRTKGIGKIEGIEETNTELFVIADIPEGNEGLYPAIGFRVNEAHVGEHGARVIDSLTLYEISLCKTENVDKSVPPIR